MFGQNLEHFGFNAQILNEDELMAADFAPLEVRTLRLLVEWNPDTGKWDKDEMSTYLSQNQALFEISMHTEIIYEPVFD